MSRPVKRSFAIKGHRTSISLEAPFWDALKDAATEQRSNVSAIVARIDATRGKTGLSSAVRIWLLTYFRTQRQGQSGGEPHDKVL